MVYTRRAGHSADVEEDTDVGLEDGAKCVEEPAMGVDLFLVLLFEAEYELDGDDSAFGAFNFEGRGYGNLDSVFVDVGCYGVVADFGLVVGFDENTSDVS
jgi:hypothetical protein